MRLELPTLRSRVNMSYVSYPACATGKHLVLDLDECLVKTFTQGEGYEVLTRILTDPKLSNLRSRVYILDNMTWGVKRPWLDLFLSFSMANFDSVSVWSAGSPSYVNDVVRCIFRDIKEPFVVMTSDHVLREGKREYSKPLSKYYHIHSARRNTTGKCTSRANKRNTLFLDNRAENFINDVSNGVHIPDYDPECSIEAIQKDDVHLLSFIHYTLSTSCTKKAVTSPHIFAPDRYIDTSSLLLHRRYREKVSLC